MKTVFRGTFVIPWVQTELDGQRSASVDEIGPGRTWRWTGIAFVTSFAIVILFRSLLQIKTPVNIWLYNMLPDQMAVFMKTWF